MVYCFAHLHFSVWRNSDALNRLKPIKKGGCLTRRWWTRVFRPAQRCDMSHPYSMKMLSQICHFFKQILKLLFHVSVLFRKTLFQIFIFQQTPFFLCQPHFFFQKRIYTADFNLINHFYDIVNEKIRYNGINTNKIKKADLRHSL